MRHTRAIIAATVAFVFGAASAFADHNSQNGPGTANMPNDIHNQRVETMEADDNEAFREFVRYGEGADSVNSEADEETIAPRVQEKKGQLEQKQEQVRSGDRNMVQEKKMQQTRDPAMQGSGNERQIRRQTNRESRNTNRTTTRRATGRRGSGNGGSRGGGGRRGGGKG